MRHRCALYIAFVVGCGPTNVMSPADGGSPWREASTLDDDAAAPDASAPDASVPIEDGVAPDGAIDGELPGGDETPIEARVGEPVVVRIEAMPNEHVTFFLTFERDAEVDLEVLRWDGEAPVVLGLTDAGPGLRTLAAFDADGPRTFWARITANDADLDAALTITRVPFEDAATCSEDCTHLLQLPLPNDPFVDGYDTRASTIFRYQYGRRDLVMFVRHAARHMVDLGLAPIIPEDFSQWNGETPGTDTGSPRHASHQRGKDVDLSLYGDDGLSEWRSYCTTESTSDGRECIAGTRTNFDGYANALFFGDFFATGRVTMCFLDGELIPGAIDGAEEASMVGELDPTLVPMFSDGRHLQHWPNHDNHIHVRVSEAPLSTLGLDLREPVFEAP